MIGLQDLYTKFTNTAFKSGLKPARNALSTPPFTFLGKINTSNLAPLQADTISFTGTKTYRATSAAYDTELLGKVSKNPVDLKSVEVVLPPSCVIYSDYKGVKSSEKSSVDFDNSVKNLSNTAKSIYRDVLPIASKIHEEASKAKDLFELKMCIFDCLLNSNADKSAKGTRGPLASKTIRVKSTQSIASKLANKFGELIEENDYYYVPITKDIAKSKIHDVLGARLILQNGQTGEANAVINKLMQSIKNGNGPKIKAIKNYGKSQAYLNYSKIEELEEVIAKAGYKHPEITDRRKLSGYTATHIIIEVGNGIDAEIQIFGRGVDRVKHVDDVCYKGMQGKHIKGLSVGTLKELKKVGQDPELALYYNKYLASAYAQAKRKWDKMPNDELVRQKFPSIDTAKFPSCLDLNNIEAEMELNIFDKNPKRS